MDAAEGHNTCQNKKDLVRYRLQIQNTALIHVCTRGKCVQGQEASNQ